MLGLKDALLEMYEGEFERCGIILRSGELVELENIHPEPTAGFRFRGQDILRLETTDTIGTWHTHPNATSNLSQNDFNAFNAWPRLVHYIIGNDGITKYQVVQGDLIGDPVE